MIMLKEPLPVNDAHFLVQVFKSLGYLDNHVSRKVFAEVCEAHNLMEQFATRRKLKYDVVILSGFGKIDQFNDIRVIELAHNLYFFQDVCSLSRMLACKRIAGFGCHCECDEIYDMP